MLVNETKCNGLKIVMNITAKFNIMISVRFINLSKLANQLLIKESSDHIYLSFRPMFVIPTEAEESCHFLILLKCRGMRSLHCGRDDN